MGPGGGGGGGGWGLDRMVATRNAADRPLRKRFNRRPGVGGGGVHREKFKKGA